MVLSAPRCAGKPNHTDLHVQSYHPVAHKPAVIRTLMGRAKGLSSSTANRVEEKHVVQALQRNGYPEGFIQRHTCLHTGRAAQQDSET